MHKIIIAIVFMAASLPAYGGSMMPFERDNIKKIMRGAHYAKCHDHQLPPNKFWAAMIFRHDLNPIRFHYWHPIMGKLIDLMRKHHPKPPLPWPPHCDNPPYFPPCDRPDDPKPCRPVVSEPSSMVMASVPIIFCLMYRKLRW